MGEIVVVILHIYEARTIYLLFYDDSVMTKTPNLSNGKYKWAHTTNINTSKYIKGSMVNLYPYSTKRDKTVVVILHIDG